MVDFFAIDLLFGAHKRLCGQTQRKEKGYYEYVDKDLNDGTGSSQYVYLGYKRTDDPAKAITNIMMFLYGDGQQEQMTVDGITYTLSGDVNLNRHCVATSADIFLYYRNCKLDRLADAKK